MSDEVIDANVAKTDAKLSESVRDLIGTYDGLEWSERGGIDSGDEYVFVKVDHDKDVAPPDTLPCVTDTDYIYFLIPADIDLPKSWKEDACPFLADDVVHEGVASTPEAEDWPDDATIINAIRKHASAVRGAKEKREARKVFERDRYWFASGGRIDKETPMLIEGLMRERGVSVFYGAFDEFKTTLVLDMVAHVAMGAPWQGRKVKPRPVIWYALEGEEEIPVRLRALEASLKGKDTVWGKPPAPVIVYDRIPEKYADWRGQITRTSYRLNQHVDARRKLNDFEMTKRNGFQRLKAWERDDTIDTITVPNLGEVPEEWRGYVISEDARESDQLYLPCMDPVYPQYFGSTDGNPPVIVIDTLSMALGGDDEKGPRAAGFVTECLDLLKERPGLINPYDKDTDEAKYYQWYDENPEIEDIDYPVAAHVIIIHHQTKTGIDFAGHRAIAANTQGLYRVHRFGKITDGERRYAGQLTPIRVKGIPRPAPIRFDVDVVPVDGTKQKAAILKDKATAIPKELKPIIKALRGLEDPEAITPADLNECIDVAAARGAKDGSTKRKARQRYREKLEAAGVIEPIEDEDDKVAFYRFHDTVAV